VVRGRDRKGADGRNLVVLRRRDISPCLGFDFRFPFEPGLTDD
jgi:hypothetical protein